MQVRVKHCEASDQEEAGRSLQTAMASPRTKEMESSETDLRRRIRASDLFVCR